MELAELKIIDHGIAAQHNVRCPVCVGKDAHAVLYMNEGTFEPCWKCQKKGWRTIRAAGWKLWLLKRLGLVRG